MPATEQAPVTGWSLAPFTSLMLSAHGLDARRAGSLCAASFRRHWSSVSERDAPISRSPTQRTARAGAGVPRSGTLSARSDISPRPQRSGTGDLSDTCDLPLIQPPKKRRSRRRKKKRAPTASSTPAKAAALPAASPPAESVAELVQEARAKQPDCVPEALLRRRRALGRSRRHQGRPELPAVATWRDYFSRMPPSTSAQRAMAAMATYGQSRESILWVPPDISGAQEATGDPEQPRQGSTAGVPKQGTISGAPTPATSRSRTGSLSAPRRPSLLSSARSSTGQGSLAPGASPTSAAKGSSAPSASQRKRAEVASATRAMELAAACTYMHKELTSTPRLDSKFTYATAAAVTLADGFLTLANVGDFRIVAAARAPMHGIWPHMDSKPRPSAAGQSAAPTWQQDTLPAQSATQRVLAQRQEERSDQEAQRRRRYLRGVHGLSTSASTGALPSSSAVLSAKGSLASPLLTRRTLPGGMAEAEAGEALAPLLLSTLWEAEATYENPQKAHRMAVTLAKVEQRRRGRNIPPLTGPPGLLLRRASSSSSLPLLKALRSPARPQASGIAEEDQEEEEEGEEEEDGPTGVTGLDSLQVTDALISTPLKPVSFTHIAETSPTEEGTASGILRPLQLYDAVGGLRTISLGRPLCLEQHLSRPDEAMRLHRAAGMTIPLLKYTLHNLRGVVGTAVALFGKVRGRERLEAAEGSAQTPEDGGLSEAHLEALAAAFPEPELSVPAASVAPSEMAYTAGAYVGGNASAASLDSDVGGQTEGTTALMQNVTRTEAAKAAKAAAVAAAATMGNAAGTFASGSQQALRALMTSAAGTGHTSSQGVVGGDELIAMASPNGLSAGSGLPWVVLLFPLHALITAATSSMLSKGGRGAAGAAEVRARLWDAGDLLPKAFHRQVTAGMSGRDPWGLATARSARERNAQLRHAVADALSTLPGTLRGYREEIDIALRCGVVSLLVAQQMTELFERLIVLTHATSGLGSVWCSRALGGAAWAPSGLLHNPEVTTHRLTVHDRFLVIASGAVWSVLSTQAVSDIVHDVLDSLAWGGSLTELDGHANEAADGRDMVRRCLKLGNALQQFQVAKDMVEHRWGRDQEGSRARRLAEAARHLQDEGYNAQLDEAAYTRRIMPPIVSEHPQALLCAASRVVVQEGSRRRRRRALVKPVPVAEWALPAGASNRHLREYGAAESDEDEPDATDESGSMAHGYHDADPFVPGGWRVPGGSSSHSHAGKPSVATPHTSLSLPVGIRKDITSGVTSIASPLSATKASAATAPTLPSELQFKRCARWHAVALAAAETVALEATARFAQVCAQLTSAVSAVDGTVGRVREHLRHLIQQRLDRSKASHLRVSEAASGAALTEAELRQLTDADISAAARAFKQLPELGAVVNFTELQRIVGARDISVQVIVLHAPM